jgi:hypothetical protein
MDWPRGSILNIPDPEISIGDCIQPMTSTSDIDLEDQETPCWQINASGGCKKYGIVSE